ncbi:septum formation inhibitor Maf [Bradyrhizobium pachyrhizi]|uniref:Nucleoside triphosphate pyrophosphatase n=1 Tax=Bradyrhizobium pachyrhizi TaxID=280333 RepID=A0A844SPL9_9BRAD|nr:Maf family protein [Bradyrhizobium pachyrhizi]MVT64931.1 septum formation inhibitor Maf [Bradyrhizobium pachyrhizi]
MTDNIILASESPLAEKLLKNAGINVELQAADLDDGALEAPLVETGSSPEDVALVVAEAKATEISGRNSGAIVLGCKQVLALDDEILRGPADMDEGRKRLLLLSGRSHQVNSAAVVARDGKVVWRRVGVARLTMCKLDPGYIGRYLARVGPSALQSPGVNAIDGEGIQLFSEIDGDYFTILGLPLLDVLAELRRLRIIDR